MKFSYLNDDISHPKCHFPVSLIPKLRNKGSKKLDFSPFARCSWILETCPHVNRALLRADAGSHFVPEVNVMMKKIRQNMKKTTTTPNNTYPCMRPVREREHFHVLCQWDLALTRPSWACRAFSRRSRSTRVSRRNCTSCREPGYYCRIPANAVLARGRGQSWPLRLVLVIFLW